MLRGVDIGGGRHVVIPDDWKIRVLHGQPVPGCTYNIATEKWSEVVPMINVVEAFGVDNTGASDAVPGIRLAHTRTAVSDTLFFPSGIYAIPPGTLDLGSRRYVGGRSASGNASGAVFKAMGPGDYIARVQNQGVNLDGITFDCAGLADTGLLCSHALGIVANCRVWRSAGYAFRWVESTMTSLNCQADDGNKGHYILGCNGSAFYTPIATNNTGIGLHIVGGAATGAPTSFSGLCSIFAPIVDFCSTGGVGEPLVRIEGWETGLISGGYIEGNGDGIEIGDGTHNCTFQGMGFTGGGGAVPNRVAMRLLGKVQACNFLGNVAANSTPTYPQILAMAPEVFRDNNFFGNNAGSRLDALPLPVWLDDGAGKIYRLTPQGGVLTASGPPTLGSWRVGNRISNIGASPAGWVCTKAGDAGALINPALFAAFG